MERGERGREKKEGVSIRERRKKGYRGGNRERDPKTLNSLSICMDIIITEKCVSSGVFVSLIFTEHC